MIPSNARENKQTTSPRAIAHVDTGQTHAAAAAALCALAIIVVLLLAQWMPLLGATSMGNAGEADVVLQADSVVPFMLRF